MAIDPNLVITTSVGELPTAPLSLTSLIAHETISDSLLKQATLQDLVDFIVPLVSAIQYQIITLHVDSTYIETNFDETGLGINIMAGYAIVNGQNGTTNKDGRVGIAYGATYNAVGAIGGATTHTLTVNEIPPHTHPLPADGAGSLDIQSLVNSSGADEGYSNDFPTGASTGGAAHNNMQPYLVELQIMKL